MERNCKIKVCSCSACPYGTGDYLNLEKRKCSINIELTPCGANFLCVVMDIGEDRYTFWPSSAMGGQFSEFMEAVYAIYSEYGDHHNVNRSNVIVDKQKNLRSNVVSTCSWDEEGNFVEFSFSRYKYLYNADNAILLPEDDPVEMTVDNKKYTVDGHDLAYAIAKAATEVIKTYGFFGYYSTTGSGCIGDIIDINQLLFFKAYALNVMDVRKLKTEFQRSNSWQHACSSSFEKELELLLFDM